MHGMARGSTMQDELQITSMAIGEVETSSQVSTIARLELPALRRVQDSTDQVLALSGSVGGQVKVKVGNKLIVGNVRSLSQMRGVDGGLTGLRAEVELLGEGHVGADGRLQDFQRGLTRNPSPGDTVFPVNREELSALFSARHLRHLDIGTVYPTNSLRAVIDANALLSRHFALLGTTGSGKSSATALILHRLIEKAPNGHILVIDPHGEYPRSFASQGQVFNVENLALPYWLMSFEEHCEVFITSEGEERELDVSILGRCLAAARSKSILAGPGDEISVNSPIPYLMADLIGALNGEMGKLDNVSEISRYVRLNNRMQEILRNNRYGFMFNRALTADTMKQFLSRILSLGSNSRSIAIIDLSGVPSDIVSVVVALISRIVMDHAIWSRDDDHRPVLLVCEEAHRYIPADPVPGSASVRRSLERIAKEGRKYGVALGLISQRPSDIAEGALSQCGSIIAMRMNNERDHACVRSAMPEGGRGLLDSLSGLRTGECIIAGEAVQLPFRIKLDLLPEELRPYSDDPSFTDIWMSPAHHEDRLERTIRRWRNLKSTEDSSDFVERPSLLRR
jgi:hypothetical protein